MAYRGANGRHTVQYVYLILHLGMLNSSNVIPYLPLLDYSA